jgi:nitrogen PTS system EIIA component
MKLASLMQHELILWNLPVNTFKEVYGLVSTQMAEVHHLDKAPILEAFRKQDETGLTVLENGIVLLHGRMSDFDDLLIAVARTAKPIPVNNGESDTFIFLLTSRTGSNLYLKTLACFAKLIMEHGADLKKQTGPHELLEYLQQNAVNVLETLKVRDIMSKNVVSVHPDDTIEQAIDVMKKHDLVYLPVVDAQNRFLGKIYMLNILMLAYPDYMLQLQDVPSSGSSRAFEELTEKESRMKVRDLYDSAPEKAVDQDMNVYSMGFSFIKNKWRHAAVIDKDKKVVGIVSLRDILNHVIRA